MMTRTKMLPLALSAFALLAAAPSSPPPSPAASSQNGEPAVAGRGAAVCGVPGSYATIQAAVDDPGCFEVVVAAGLYSESVDVGRTLTLRGAGAAATTVAGQLRIAGGGTTVDLRDLEVDVSSPAAGACFDQALLAEGGAEVSTADVAVVYSRVGLGIACALFVDGFESGDTEAWSSATP